MRGLLAFVLVGLAGAPASADDTTLLDGVTVVFAKGAALIKGDARGKTEVELAPLPAVGVVVRALRTDPAGTVLLADIGGKWYWMPLDGTAKTLSELPCADGPAQLALDGACVLCRSVPYRDKSLIVHLASGKQTVIDVPSPGTRLVGAGAERKLVWTDASGVWSSPPGDPKTKTKLSPDAPLRYFLPTGDGKRAVGVYMDVVHEGKQTTPGEVLMTFALDGVGARRKTVRAAVPVEWSHDGNWMLVQDGAKACIASAAGGQYKCWRGYTAASIAPDGSYALILGNRDGSKKQVRPGEAKKDPKKAPQREEPSEPENSTELTPIDDVDVAPPVGPLALFRAENAGAHTAAPARIYTVVDGAAVWIAPKP